MHIARMWPFRYVIGSSLGPGPWAQMSYVWVWAKTQEALVDLVVNGMGITFTLSFVVLVFATGNVVLALISIATIAGALTPRVFATQTSSHTGAKCNALGM